MGNQPTINRNKYTQSPLPNRCTHAYLISIRAFVCIHMRDPPLIAATAAAVVAAAAAASRYVIDVSITHFMSSHLSLSRFHFTHFVRAQTRSL